MKEQFSNAQDFDNINDNICKKKKKLIAIFFKLVIF
jgi:hypothetical protein